MYVEVEELHKCWKPDCMRKISIRSMFCCHACDLANQGRYEIHDSGPLGHSEDCNVRAQERGECNLYEAMFMKQGGAP